MSERNLTPPSRTSTGSSIEVTALSDSLWKARILFPSAQISDQEMLIRLREAKQRIATDFNIPIELLEFRELLEKEKTYSGVFAHVTIGRIQVGKGKTLVRFKPLKAPTGEVFTDMIAEADFYYLDEFDQIVAEERLISNFEKSGICRECLNPAAIRTAMNFVEERRSLVQGVEIARGTFPDQGTDAELEYTFYTDPGAAPDLSDYRSSRKVKTGDILCQKIPPKDGKATGMNVRGGKISPQKGLDFKLIAGDGAKVSLDGTRITALRDGQAVMTRSVRQIYTTTGKKIVPNRIEISVEELISIRGGDKPININTSDSVEILGNVKAGSTIISRGEVFLQGDVEEGAQIHGEANVIIKGQIEGAQVASNASVIGEKGAKDAQISARDTIKLKGKAENSELVARCVELLESLGSNIIASYKVQMERAGNDSSGRKTTIQTGKRNFYVRQLKANQNAITSLTASLERLQNFFGKDTLAQAEGDNLQRVLLNQLETLRNKGYKSLNTEQVQSLKKLLEAVKPMRSILNEKSEEISSLQQKVNEPDAEQSMVIIREKIQDPVEVTIEETTQTISPSPEGVIITPTDSGTLSVYPFLPPAPDQPSDTTKAKDDQKK